MTIIRQGDDCLWNGQIVNLAGISLRGKCVIHFVVDGNPHVEQVDPDELFPIVNVQFTESPAHAQISPLIARAYAAYTRAVLKDQRVLDLTGEGRHEDAADEAIMRDTSALDFLRAFVALEQAMPDVFERLKGDAK
jgi:hypothetical protein